MCGGMAYNATEQTVVLANLASGRASRCVLYSSRSGFEGGNVRASLLVVMRASASRVGLTEGRRSHNSGHGDVL
jgi:hypothetical protein